MKEAEASAAAVDATGLPPGRALDLQSVLSSIRETAYHWDFRSDRMVWAANARQILTVIDPARLANGAAFAHVMVPEHAANRLRAIRDSGGSDAGNGVGYRLQYPLGDGVAGVGAASGRNLWVEEQGRWFAGPDGAPAYARAVVRVVNDRYEEEQRLRYLSERHVLTGLMNRRSLTEAMDVLFDAPDADDGPPQGGLILVAVNDLTMINEAYGFDVGDEVVAGITRRLSGALPTGCLMGHFGSNKFAIVVPGQTPDHIGALAEGLRIGIREATLQTQAGALAATVSLGWVETPRDAAGLAQAFARVMEALEKAKLRRTDCVVRYAPSTQQESRRRRNIAAADEIIRALNDRRMALALQPVVQTDTREVACHEVLLRMHTPDGEVVTAGQFVPLAEELGLSHLIDYRTLELTAALLKAYPDRHLAMNVSGQTLADPYWLDALWHAVAADRSITQRLMVEITETSVIGDIDVAITFVRALKDMGCYVAIDDFGAGYSSFRNLKLLGVDVVKIDGSFITSILSNNDDQVFVRALSELSANFGIKTVAEFVGDEATAQLLAKLGIDYLQGFYFGEPDLDTDRALGARAQQAG